MPRPMMILAGERQPGKQVSPIREQNVAPGVAPITGLGSTLRWLRGTQIGRVTDAHFLSRTAETLATR